MVDRLVFSGMILVVTVGVATNRLELLDAYSSATVPGSVPALGRDPTR